VLKNTNSEMHIPDLVQPWSSEPHRFSALNLMQFDPHGCQETLPPD
jgi:hypothetical protein